MSYMCHIIIHICMRLYVLQISSCNWPEFRNCRSRFPHSWVGNCNETGSDLGRVAKNLRKQFIPCKIYRKFWNILKQLSLPAMSSDHHKTPRNDPQDSPFGNASMQCTSSKTRFLLLGSNDQTQIFDLNSLSDMNYHDCFDSFVCFWLPVTIIYNRHKHYQQHRHLIKKWISNTCSPMFPQPLFPVATAGQFFAFRWYSPWQGCCFRTEKQYIHSPSMTTLPR